MHSSEDVLFKSQLLLVACVIVISPDLGIMPRHGIPKSPAEKTPFSLDAAVQAAAEEHNVDPKLVKSIIAAESSFHEEVISKKGAIGLMQVMPETGEELGYDVTDSEQNVRAGSKYLSFLLSRYKGKRNGLRMAIAAYNAGPGNVERYRGVPPFKETRTYVKRVLGYLATYRRSSSETLSGERGEDGRAETVLAD